MSTTVSELTTSPTASGAHTFEALADQHRIALSRLARRLAGHSHDAEDLLQETLIDAYRSFHRFRPGSNFYSWVARIMANNQFDRLRRGKRHLLVPLETETENHAEGPEAADHRGNPERLLLEDQLEAPYADALDSLQPQHRATVMLCDLEGATYEEAARAEECPIGTIRSRLHRAHNALRRMLAGFDPDREPEPIAPGIHSRRCFLRMGTAAAAGAAMTLHGTDPSAAADLPPLRVLLWADAAQRPALAAALTDGEGLHLRATGPGSADAGLSDSRLSGQHVLVFCESSELVSLPPQRLAAIARRVMDGTLGVVLIGPAADSPLLRALLGVEAGWSGAKATVDVMTLQVRAPRHPIVRGIPGLQVTEATVPTGTFQGPQPEVVLLDRTDGPTGWQGAVWTVGRGRLFCFAPSRANGWQEAGELTHRLLSNAAEWASLPARG